MSDTSPVARFCRAVIYWVGDYDMVIYASLMVTYNGIMLMG